MFELPWYMRDYYYIINVILLVIAAWLFRQYMKKHASKTIVSKQLYSGVIELLKKHDETTPPVVSGNDAVRIGRVISNIGDLFFYIVILVIVIFTFVEFGSIFGK